MTHQYKPGDDVIIAAKYLGEDCFGNIVVRVTDTDGDNEEAHIDPRHVHPATQSSITPSHDDDIEKLRAEVERIGNELKILRC